MTRPTSPPVLRPRVPGSRGGARRSARLLLVALLAAAWAAVVGQPPAAAEARWQWPLPPPQVVLAPFEDPLSDYGPGHRGIDISAAEGAEVRAVEAGTVRFSGMVAGRGVISVRHADGLLSTYEPVRASVEAGARVQAGDVIGVVELGEAAGHCAGQTCLHLGARRGEDYLDPMLLLGVRGPSVLLPWEGASAGTGVPGPAAPRTALRSAPSQMVSSPGGVSRARPPLDGSLRNGAPPTERGPGAQRLALLE